VAALLRSQIEHGKREALRERADLAALFPLSEGERLVIWDTAGRCCFSCGGNFIASKNANVLVSTEYSLQNSNV
jgi:hypothetical protein